MKATMWNEIKLLSSRRLILLLNCRWRVQKELSHSSKFYFAAIYFISEPVSNRNDSRENAINFSFIRFEASHSLFSDSSLNSSSDFFLTFFALAWALTFNLVIFVVSRGNRNKLNH